MADLKSCDRCGISEPADSTTICKVRIGTLDPDGLLVKLIEIPFDTDLCAACRGKLTECLFLPSGKVH